jgi:uncharacterized membrane protein
MRSRSILFLFVFLVALPANAATFTAPTYTIQQLPGIASAISNTGWVAGTLTDAQGHPHAYRCRAGKLEMLAEFAGHQSRGIGINDYGDVAGVVLTVDGSPWQLPGHSDLYAPALFTNGTVQAYYPISSVDDGWANAINNAAEIVGGSYFASYYGIEAIQCTGASRPLAKLPDMDRGEALAINQRGQCVGWARDSNDGLAPPQAVIWDLGYVWALPVSDGGCSVAQDINDSGFTVGTVTFGVASVTPISFPAGWDSKNHSLAYPLAGNVQGTAVAINNAGLAVGTSSNGFAMLYAQGQAFRLESLVTNTAGWTLTSALDINDAGQILVSGVNGSNTGSFLLTPVVVGGRYVPPSGGR